LNATIIQRVTLDAPEAVTSAGPSPTIYEVAAWAGAKLGLNATSLVPEALGYAVASNDWTDDKGIRHVRLEQHVGWCDCV